MTKFNKKIEYVDPFASVVHTGVGRRGEKEAAGTRCRVGRRGREGGRAGPARCFGYRGGEGGGAPRVGPRSRSAAPQFASPCLLRRGVRKQGPCVGRRGEKEAADRRGGAARRGVARSRGGEWGAAAAGLGVGTGE